MISIPSDDSVSGVSQEILDEAAKLVAKVMFKTPSYVEMMRIEESRLNELETLFSTSFYYNSVNSPRSLNFRMDEGGKVIGFYILMPYAACHFSVFQTMYMAGEILLKCSTITFRRIVTAAMWFDEVSKRVMDGRQFMVLQRMAVEPTLQGQGIGSRLLQQATDHADKLQLPIILSTQEQRNVAFYSRL
jgi:GNAT superfamily N-acetyltransferase